MLWLFLYPLGEGKQLANRYLFSSRWSRTWCWLPWGKWERMGAGLLGTPV